MTATLLFLALATVLVALTRTHHGPLSRNPGLWLTFLCIPVALLASSGRLAITDKLPPPIAFVVLGGLAWVGLSLAFGKVKPGVAGIRALLGVSLARIPVEAMLHSLADAGQIPVQMTWSGTNFDIFSGLAAAFLLAWSFFRPLPTGWLTIYNILALGLVLNVAITGILSAPSPFQHLNFQQPNMAILYFPYALLVGAIVPAVIYTHLRMLIGIKS